MEYIFGKRVGVWGHGIVGASALRYLATLAPQELHLYDTVPLTPETHAILTHHNIRVHNPDALSVFLSSVDTILPSPGVDIRPYRQLPIHYLNEFQLFHRAWQGPVIAITGSFGKTTITHALAALLNTHGHTAYAGGNIGRPMFDLLSEDITSTAVIELSSFQLELGVPHPPDLTIITNIVPNHLDRHGTYEAYIQAKCELIRHGSTSRTILAPLKLAPTITAIGAPLHQYHWFHDSPITSKLGEPLDTCIAKDTLYIRDNNTIYAYRGSHRHTLGSVPKTFASFPVNALILAAALEIRGVADATDHLATISTPLHRCTLVGTYHGVTWYNDSKSTLPETTLAAVQRLQEHPIILIIGGKSKGVSRKSLIAQLCGKVRYIVFFGAESEQLHIWAQEYGIMSSAHSTLETAVQVAAQQTSTGWLVLFSPAGTSYDLFKNFEERGKRFTELVQQLR